jgi:hypothetical protein
VCHGPVLTNAEYVYGDSVASYTPIYIKHTNPVTKVETIEALTISELGSKYGKTDGLS